MHPVSCDLVPQDLIVVLRAKYNDYIQNLLELANNANLGIDEDEIIRLFFVLQMSAFGRYKIGFLALN